MQQFKLTTSFIFLLFCTSNLRAQQEYSGESVFNCDGQGNTTLSTSYLYTCNTQNPSCPAFLIFRAQRGYNSVSTISDLLSVDPAELTRINNVSDSSTFQTNGEVIIPVNCSCSGWYYQANASHVIVEHDRYSHLANDKYQGLSTCNALVGENPYNPDDLQIGQQVLVPLRCACPTEKQAADGVNYLLTYSVYEDDNVPDLSDRFGVSAQKTAFANNFSEDPVIYQLTTILIPLPREPLSSQTIIHYPVQQSPFPSPTAPRPTNQVVKRSKKHLVAAISTGFAIFLVLCAVLPIAFWHHRRRKRQTLGKKECSARKDILAAIADADHILKIFEFEELKVATNNFSTESRIEGSVHRGLVRGSMSAVKETSRDASKEVNILHRLNHFNLISLCGICMGPEKCYLVYEYMENGSLKDWLRDTSRLGLWSWTQRVHIALDVANGLDYLHNFAELPYIHENLNSSNVLLNGNFRAKIANFSFARSSERREDGFLITARVKGTIGYMAPEYLESGLVTPKIDVYAFGVVMSELITGNDAMLKHGGREKLLSAAIISIVQGTDAEDELREFMDDSIRSRCRMIQALAMAKLSAACMNEDPGSRPSMAEVVSTLSRIQGDQDHWGVEYI